MKKKQDRKYDLTLIQHDPAHCLTPGLFRSLKKGDYKRDKLDITYDYGDGVHIEISGPEPLGADDLRVLQGLVAMAGINGKILPPMPQGDAGKELRRLLETKWQAMDENAMTVRCSYNKLADEIGYTHGGSSYRIIKKCVERLWKISVIIDKNGKRWGFHILSEYASDDRDEQLFIALNPLITHAVRGGGQNVRISMAEVRKIKNDATILVHQRLCGWINPGKIGRIEIDTVCSYIWPDETTNEATKRKRRQLARKALAELETIDWKIKEYAAGKWQIKRAEITS